MMNMKDLMVGLTGYSVMTHASIVQLLDVKRHVRKMQSAILNLVQL